MIWARKAGQALILSSVLSAVGCCYHAQDFGHTRDIGIGEIGCGTCKSTNNCSPSNGTKTASADQSANPAAKDAARGTATASNGRSLLSRLRDTFETRRTERVSGELPIYVLPSECVSTGMIVSPGHATTYQAMPRMLAPEVTVRDVVVANE